MKCVCGYEGDDFQEMKLKEITTWEDINGNEVGNDIGYVVVYACPKCGTLKIEVENDRRN